MSDKKKDLVKEQTRTLLGWREWVTLPRLGIPALKVKVDTGARTSALHAFSLETFTEDGVRKVRFEIHPLQKRTDVVISCVAEVVDERVVTDSGGHKEKRVVIKTPLQLGQQHWDVEFTLTDRDTMRFRALLGRSAIRDRCIVDPRQSFLTGRKLAHDYLKTLKGKNRQ